MAKKISTLRTVIEQPKVVRRSMQRFYSYSRQTLTAMTGRCDKTIRRDIAAGKLEIDSLESVCRYLERHSPAPESDDGPTSAWEVLRAMNLAYGTSRVMDELYQWFAADARTLSYVTAGVQRLLRKPEAEALQILKNAARRLEGVPAAEWREFVAAREHELALSREGRREPMMKRQTCEPL